jgi:hypothetical protein
MDPLVPTAPGARTLSKPEWRARIQVFQQGEWLTLLAAASPHPASTNISSNLPPVAPANATGPTDLRRRERARHLVHIGELSTARQALTATQSTASAITTWIFPSRLSFRVFLFRFGTTERHLPQQKKGPMSLPHMPVQWYQRLLHP